MTILNRAILAIMLWTTLEAGTAMSAIVQPLVNTDWVAENLDNEKVVLIDLQNKIDGGSYQTYLEGHIPTSVHSDYLKDGWRVGRDDVVGLLPIETQFEALARKLGVSQNSHVVLIWVELPLARRMAGSGFLWR